MPQGAEETASTKALGQEEAHPFRSWPVGLTLGGWGNQGQGADGEQMGQGLRCQERGLIFILQEMKGTLGPVASGGL